MTPNMASSTSSACRCTTGKAAELAWGRATEFFKKHLG